MPYKISSALAIVLAAGALSACGQKGPLYLPQDAAAPAEPAAVTPMASPVDTAPRMAAPQAGKQGEDSEQNKTSAAGAEAASSMESTTNNNTTEPVIEK